MPKFRKKPVVIEAVQWTGRYDDLNPFGPGPKPFRFDMLPDMHIETKEGVMRAEPGDWIIRGIQGEYYPCKPDIFEKTYESVAQ